MRATILTAILLPALLLVTVPARSAEPPPPNEDAAAAPAEPAAPAASDAAATDATDVVEAAAPEAATASAARDEGDFLLPPGFKTKKRGKFTLYCKREAVLGSRFPAEKCYDEEGIRAMLRSQLEDREKVDQMRRICGSMEACGGG